MALNAPIFSWTPSYEPVQTKKTRIIEARFGDGYSQRARDGLNSVSRAWKLQWVNEDQAIAEAIDDFLTERGNVEPFYYIDTTGLRSGLYTCETWDKSDTGPGLCTVTATFDESFAIVNELQPAIDAAGSLDDIFALANLLYIAINEVLPE